MKKLVAFVMVLSLGLFCAAACNKAPEKKAGDKAPTGAPATEEKKAGDKAAPAATDKPADKAPPAPAAPEKK